MNSFSHKFFTALCFEQDLELKGEKTDKTNERLIDTLQDLAGYAIISEIYVKGKIK